MATMLEDKDAIREVLARYCYALDDGRFADMAALFTEDGTWHRQRRTKGGLSQP